MSFVHGKKKANARMKSKKLKLVKVPLNILDQRDSTNIYAVMVQAQQIYKNEKATTTSFIYMRDIKGIKIPAQCLSLLRCTRNKPVFTIQVTQTAQRSHHSAHASIFLIPVLSRPIKESRWHIFITVITFFHIYYLYLQIQTTRIIEFLCTHLSPVYILFTKFLYACAYVRTLSLA